MNKRNRIYNLIPLGIFSIIFWGCNSTEPKNTNLPVVTIVEPQEGFITNSATVSIICSVNGKILPPISKTLKEGANQISCSAKDSAGNTGMSGNRMVYQNSKILFVNNDAQAGGNGSSWEKAYNQLDSALLDKKTDTAGTQIWIAEGIYTPILEGYRVPAGIRLYGGFPKVGPKFLIGQRDSMATKTKIESKEEIPSLMEIMGQSGANNLNEIELNSLEFTGPSGNGLSISKIINAKISNCSFTKMDGFKAVYFTGGGGSFKNCKFHHNKIGNNIVEAWSISENGLVFENCVFESNAAVSAIILASGDKGNISILNSQFLDSLAFPDSKAFTFDLPLAIFKRCKVKGGINTIENTKSGGQIDYDGSNQSPL
jgi:hypothetical protein